jgi:pyruvate dehydrogenase E2 component (dihydrolipoamide acetyltransferase)
MPEVLAGSAEAAIQTWLVTPGQALSVGVPLAEVETEKAVVEYASEHEGTVLQLLVAEGVSVKVGDPIAVVGAKGESVDVPSASPEVEAAAQAAAARARGCACRGARCRTRRCVRPPVHQPSRAPSRTRAWP